MRNLQTFSLLQDYLDKDHSWRIKEIANFKMDCKNPNLLKQRGWLRAATPILYAHWEGFVKNAATAYVNFVDCQGNNYEDLQSCLVVFGLKNHIHSLLSSKNSSVNFEVVEFFRTEIKNQARLKFANAINTEANLSSQVFKNIAESIGIDTTPYESKYNLIDISLLKRRNRIAHGEYLDIGPGDYSNLADETLILLRQFKTDIENSAVLGKYLRSRTP